LIKSLPLLSCKTSLSFGKGLGVRSFNYFKTHHIMKFFFSCDWGTSTFRLRLVDAENIKVLSEIKTRHGIAIAFESWKQTNQQEKTRLAFYQTYLFEQVKKITVPFNDAVKDAPIILSGMASSSIGMIELPYKEIPFPCKGSGLVIYIIPADEDHRHKMIMISGARTDVDVIRGEETMLAGCKISEDDSEQLFIFPGTHSKHIIVKNGLVKNITTYMTGELFDLLSNKSILSASVKKDDPEPTGSNRFFIDGVLKGRASILSNSIFHVRTNHLFKKTTPGENYDYLSGLLIGHELKDVSANKPPSITLVCSEGLKKSYTQALNVLELASQVNYENADEALINGQWIITQQLGYL
ncbi:MAG: 2-dehydro-3-deoxygalactonokinase, partial [Ferruginibacter sp.]